MGPTKAMNPAGRGPQPRHPLASEQIIADALVDVASELRLPDAAELMSMILNDHAANIADLVNSSTELFSRAAPCLRAVGKLHRALGRNSGRRDRHGVPPRRGLCVFSSEDRTAPGRGRDHRYSVRRTR